MTLYFTWNHTNPCFCWIYLEHFVSLVKSFQTIWNSYWLVMQSGAKRQISLAVGSRIDAIAIEYFNWAEYGTYQCYRTNSVKNHFWASNMRIWHKTNQISPGGRFYILMTPLLFSNSHILRCWQSFFIYFRSDIKLMKLHSYHNSN
jgi:hypothetical protein